MKILRSWRQDRLLRSVLANSSYLFSSNSATIVLSMAQGVFAARLLGVEGFGLVSGTIIPFISTVNRLSSFRMSELVVKYLGEYLAAEDRARAAAVAKGAALTDVLASAIGFGLVVLLAPLAAVHLAKDAGVEPLFILYGIILLFNATFETGTGVLQARDRFRSIAVVNLLQSLITAGLIFGAYLTDRGILEVLLAYLLGKSFAGLAISGLALRELRATLGADWWRAPLNTIPNWSGLARFAASTNLNGTINLITRDGETLFISFLRSPAEAGLFRVALSVINLVLLPVQPLIGTTYAEIARTVARRRWAETRGLLGKVSTLAGAWTLATAGGLAVFGSWLIGRVFGAEFAPAYPALLILLAGYGFANVFFWNRPLLLTLGLPTFPLKTAAAAGTVKTALSFWLVPGLGYLAQAVLLSIFFLASIGANVIRGLREIAGREQPSLAGPPV